MYEQLMVISLIMRPSREYKKFVEKVVLKSKAEQVNGPMIDKSIVSRINMCYFYQQLLIRIFSLLQQCAT